MKKMKKKTQKRGRSRALVEELSRRDAARKGELDEWDRYRKALEWCGVVLHDAHRGVQARILRAGSAKKEAVVAWTGAGIPDSVERASLECAQATAHAAALRVATYHLGTWAQGIESQGWGMVPVRPLLPGPERREVKRVLTSRDKRLKIQREARAKQS